MESSFEWLDVKILSKATSVREFTKYLQNREIVFLHIFGRIRLSQKLIYEGIFILDFYMPLTLIFDL